MFPSGAIAQAKATLQGSDAEQKLTKLLHDDSLEVLSSFQLNQIASLTYHEDSIVGGDSLCEQITEILKEVMSKPDSYSPLALNKSLIVAKHILIFGAEKIIQECMILGRHIENLKTYNTVLLAQNKQGMEGMFMRIKGGGVDKGGPVREAAEQVYELLVHRDRLMFERANQADPNSLVPVGDDQVAFVTDEVRHQALKKRMEEQQRIIIKSNLAKADNGFGGGYMSQDGKAVVGAAHGIEEMLKMERKEKNKFSDDGTSSGGGYRAPELGSVNDILYGESSSSSQVRQQSSSFQQQPTTGDLLFSGTTSGIQQRQNQQQQEVDLLGFGGAETNMPPSVVPASNHSRPSADPYAADLLVGTGTAASNVSNTADLLSMMSMAVPTKPSSEPIIGSSPAVLSGGLAAARQDSGNGDAAYLTELGRLKLSELKRKARGVGIGEDQIEGVDDEDDPKAAIISLLVDVGKPCPQPTTAAPTMTMQPTQVIGGTKDPFSAFNALASTDTTKTANLASDAESRILGGGDRDSFSMSGSSSAMSSALPDRNSLSSSIGVDSSLNQSLGGLMSMPTMPVAQHQPVSANLAPLQISSQQAPSAAWDSDDNDGGFCMGGVAGSGLEPMGMPPASAPPQPPSGF